MKPESSLIEDQSMFKVSQMIESISFDMESKGMFGVVGKHRVNIFQSF